MTNDGHVQRADQAMNRWPDRWRAATDADRHELVGQLRKEMGPGHPLRTEHIHLLACYGRDDMLFSLADGRVANVHLSWLSRAEIVDLRVRAHDPKSADWQFPGTIFFTTLDEWRRWEVYGRALNVIVEFGDRVGEREAIIRSCDLIVAYLTETTKPLPSDAAHGLGVAIKYKNGSMDVAELRAERQKLANSLDWWNRDDPGNCALRAVYSVLWFYIEDASSYQDSPSGVVSEFWALAEKFDRNEDLLRRLLKEYFA